VIRSRDRLPDHRWTATTSQFDRSAKSLSHGTYSKVVPPARVALRATKELNVERAVFAHRAGERAVEMVAWERLPGIRSAGLQGPLAGEVLPLPHCTGSDMFARARAGTFF
jgi:hypothetical protein